MTSRRVAFSALLFVGVLLLFLVLRIMLWRPRPVEGAALEDGFTRVSGVVHVHTTLSDGGGTPEQVAAAAKRAGLRFVIITDHNNLDAKPFEGEHDGVLVLVGTEISTTAGHVVGLGIPDPVFRFSGDALDALDDVRSLGGVAFAAHPLSPRPDFRWTGWELPGPWGIELVNGDSQWRSAGWPRLLRTAALYRLNARYALLGSVTPPEETLARWDTLLARREVPGIAGTDAHARLVVRKERAVGFPSYESLFALVQDHVVLDRPLSGQPGPDGEAIIAALAKGRCYVGLDALAPADDFSFTAGLGGRRFTMGDTVAPAAGLTLQARGRMPSGSRISIRRDGAVVAEAERQVELAVPGPGVYRAEVHVPGWAAPWIVSNPIYVFGAAAAAERAQRAAWAPAPPAPPAAEIIDGFEGSTPFQPGADDRSRVDLPIVDPAAGGDGRGAARLRFHLGVPAPDHPNPYCALVDWTHRDLTGHGGLVFSIKADGVYRVWLQVRDANPASTDEGTEWWFASIRTSSQWQRMAVPFDRLRSINPHTDGRLDLDKVRAIVFVIDRGADKPGTSGTIWIDELGLY
ncbi:MAG TPA: CehA/McbA family metallohydrolase [Vicinamibacteria bacterium]